MISGLPLAGLAEALKPMPSFRAKQIFKWLAAGVLSFDDMTNLPLPLRENLKERFVIRSSAVSAVLRDKDGTAKLQLTLGDGAKIEAVILEDGEGRKTACLSTQAGCPMGCVFCKTGSLGFKRNLTAAEITEQFFHIRSIASEVSRIVIMGMGEPLLNLGELRQALEVFCDAGGLNLSRRRITLSSSGIVDGIRDLAERGPDIRLALSLTTAREDLRRRLMPVTASNPLPLVKEALRYYQEKRERRITLEAVLLGGINTRKEDADALAAFARGLDAAVNLIPWNPVEGMEFEGRPLRSPAPAEAAGFAAALEERGLRVTRRYRKGLGIAGACGQLGLL